MEILFLIIGITVGAIATWLIARFKFSSDQQQSSLSLNVEREKNETLLTQIKETKIELDAERNKFIQVNSKLAEAQANNANLQQKLNDEKKEWEERNASLSIQFKNLANDILEEKSKKFTDLNKTNLIDILNPLREKISDFEKKVEQNREANVAGTSALKTQIESLLKANNQITKEAENLTRALKGDTQVQGAWGEFILESILEKSGLRKGQEYLIQESFNTEEGRLRPDVIVRLPEGRHIIIDSKVSLKSYDAFVNATSEEEKATAMKAYLLSLRQHMKGLADKKYQKNISDSGLDFVIMFIPIEPAYILAIQSEMGLYDEALEKRIVFVSPTLLIPTLQLINNVWKQEYQNKNTQEIVRQVTALYEKFKGFTDDLIDVGNQLNKTQNSYKDAMNKLSTGNGNLVKRVEDIRKLGISPSKNIEQKLIDRATEENNLL